MSAPVEVLAVMDAAIKGAEAPVRERRGHRNGLIEARAAVAELIEADVALDAANFALVGTDPQSEDAETMESMRAHRRFCIARRAAALARVKGVQP